MNRILLASAVLFVIALVSNVTSYYQARQRWSRVEDRLVATQNAINHLHYRIARWGVVEKLEARVTFLEENDRARDEFVRWLKRQSSTPAQKQQEPQLNIVQ